MSSLPIKGKRLANGIVRIVQEIAQAKSIPLVTCVNESIEWSRLVKHAAKTHGMRQIKILQAIRERARTPPRLRLNGDQVPDSFEVRASYADDLFYLLDKTRDFDATDPRDKIFALLSMTRGLSAQVAIADYNQSVEGVFIDLAVTAVTRSLSLDITSYKAPALKVVRELPGDDTRGPGFELVGDVYLLWPELEPRWDELDLDVHWNNHAIV